MNGLRSRLAREALRMTPYVLVPLCIIAALYWTLDQRRQGVEETRAGLIEKLRRQDQRIHELRGLKEAQSQLALRGTLIQALRKDGDEANTLLHLLGEIAAGNFRLERLGYGLLDHVREWPRGRERRLILELEETGEQGIEVLDQGLREQLGLEPGSRQPLAAGQVHVIYPLRRDSE